MGAGPARELDGCATRSASLSCTCAAYARSPSSSRTCPQTDRIMRLQSASMRGDPRAQTSVALRVQGGPRPVWPQPLGSGRILLSIEAAGAQQPEHPGRQFTHTGASRSLTPFSADAATEPDSPAPGFRLRGYGVVAGVAQGDRTRDSQRLAAAPRSPAGTRAGIHGPVRSVLLGRSEQLVSEDAWIFHIFPPADVGLLLDELRESTKCLDFHRMDRTQQGAFG